MTPPPSSQPNASIQTSQDSNFGAKITEKGPIAESSSAAQGSYETGGAEVNQRNIRVRIKLDVHPSIKPLVRQLAKRWKCRTNEAVSKAILDACASPEEVATFSEILKELRELKAVLNELLKGEV